MQTYTAFTATTRIAAGPLPELAAQVKRRLDAGEAAPVFIFDDIECRPLELDWRGTVDDVLSRLPIMESEQPLTPPDLEAAGEPPRGPGRPKLGVVAREVTLLPRHWDWLAGQPGGASVALRKLVEAAKRAAAGQDRVRQAREAAYRFISAMAGNEPGFEEATRALFAGDGAGFAAHSLAWPADVAAHAQRLAAPAFSAPD